MPKLPVATEARTFNVTRMTAEVTDPNAAMRFSWAGLGCLGMSGDYTLAGCVHDLLLERKLLWRVCVFAVVRVPV